jgi:hypothetical protein
MQMTRMGRIKRTTEQADGLTGQGKGQIGSQNRMRPFLQGIGVP